MAGKHLCVNLHLVWSTKRRWKFLDPEWQDRLHGYIGGIARAKNAKLLIAGSQRDHVHFYVSMPSTMSIADLVNAFKANSTRWIRQNFLHRRLFSWQEGYAAFSVSKSVEAEVIEYIRNQDLHHRRKSFQEELIDLLNRHKIEYDPRYVFD